MIKDLCLVVNTTKNCSDLWKIFTEGIYLYANFFQKMYLLVEEDANTELFEKDYTILRYKESDPYSKQFYECIKKVEEDYCIYVAEDYILYDDVKWELILEQIHVLNDNEDLSFVKLIKGPEECIPYKGYKNLYTLDNRDSNFYTNQATIWKTKHLEKIYEISPPMHIADKRNLPQFEPNAHHLCRMLNMQGVFYYNGEKKVGDAHHESSIFPYVSTALVKGRWNFREYKNILSSLLEKHNIDIYKRGIF